MRAGDRPSFRGVTGSSPERFAVALGIGVHSLRNWEQGRRMPGGLALAVLRVVARHLHVLHENLAPAG